MYRPSLGETLYTMLRLFSWCSSPLIVFFFWFFFCGQRSFPLFIFVVRNRSGHRENCPFQNAGVHLQPPTVYRGSLHWPRLLWLCSRWPPTRQPSTWHVFPIQGTIRCGNSTQSAGRSHESIRPCSHMLSLFATVWCGLFDGGLRRRYQKTRSKWCAAVGVLISCSLC